MFFPLIILPPLKWIWEVILCVFGDFSRSKSSSGFLGSIIPGAVSDVLDPAYHHVLHNTVPAGVKR